MGQITKCLYISRSFYHTAVSGRPWSNQFRAEFQRFFQSGEQPVLFALKRKPSDVFINRGAYGLSLVGIFISFYGVYLMVQDTNMKKQLKP